jgi:hypothetical protein
MEEEEEEGLETKTYFFLGTRKAKGERKREGMAYYTRGEPTCSR